MSQRVILNVTFPEFGKNYYSQRVVFRQRSMLVEDKRFAAVLMPSASNHFSNEVVGLNDQFRFLNDILASHLIDLQAGQSGNKQPRRFGSQQSA